MNPLTDPNTAPYSLPQQESPVGPDMRKVLSMRKDSTNPRKLWWQKSVVRRSMSWIEPDFEHVASKSPFLQRHSTDDKCSKGIALFHRSEIITGELLGRGGFSLVFEVTAFQLCPQVSERCTPQEQELRERYAATVFEKDGCTTRYCIKHLQERLMQKPKAFQCAASDLAVEAAFMSALDHDNILSVRGLPVDGLKAWGDGQHDGYFIISDRLSGTLAKRIQEWRNNRAPSVSERAEFASQIAAALEYLHSDPNRIVFRDLKPANIGFTADNQVKLFDFGLCREMPYAETCNGVFEMSSVGTIRYMAPEIINDARYNLKADVYGWSMVFWEILSLSKPYAPYSTDDHRRQVCRKGERPVLQQQWPTWIQNLLRLSWEGNLEHRFTSREVRVYLQAALAAEKENMNNNELDFTNHDNLLAKDFCMPDSPTGVYDFPPVTAAAATRLMDAGSINRLPDLRQDSPPPAPKRPPAYLHLPAMVVRNIAVRLSDDDDDDEGSGVCCLEMDQSFAEGMEAEVWG